MATRNKDGYVKSMSDRVKFTIALLSIVGVATLVYFFVRKPSRHYETSLHPLDVGDAAIEQEEEREEEEEELGYEEADVESTVAAEMVQKEEESERRHHQGGRTRPHHPR